LFDASRGNVEKSVELFRKDPEQTLIFSGKWSVIYAHSPIKPPRSEAQAMKEYAMTLGVPEGKIILEEKAMDFVGSALYVNEIINQQKAVGSLIVVSLDFTQRAVFMFEKMFGGRFEGLTFEKGSSRLCEEQLQKAKEQEVEKFIRLQKLYGDVQSGDSAALSSLIKRLHPLYADDPRTIPEHIRKEFGILPASITYVQKKRK
jgi:hypothetical protein